MIEVAASRLAHWLKSQVPEHPQPEENLKFAFHLVLNTVFTLTVSIILGLIIGALKETLYVLVAFGVLRMISGGYHFKSAAMCIVVSAGLGLFLPQIDIENATMIGLNVFNIVSVLVFAPSGIEGQTRISERYYPVLKVTSLVLVASNLFIGSELLAATWAVQCLSLFRFRRPLKGGETA